MYFRKKVLLAKIESVYGTDPTPTGGANAILTKNLSITPYAGQTVTRDLDRGYLGAQSQINTGPQVQVAFEIEMAGAGAAGTAPAYGPLLRACGFSETISAGVSVTYAPVGTTFESVTLYFGIDGQRHIVKGARGNVVLRMSRGQIPVYAFTLTGTYTRPTATANPTPTFTGFKDPLPVTKVNTPTFSLHSYAAICESLEIDVGNQVVYRNLINSESIIIGDRNMQGQAVLELPTLASKDYFTAAESHAGTITLSTLSVIHGTAAGGIVELSAPKVQLTSIGMQDSDGIVAAQIGLAFTPSSGNDELSIIVR